MQSLELFFVRFLSLLFLAQLSNVGTISGNFELNTCLRMIFGNSAAMGTRNKLHVSKYLFTQISGFNCRQQSNCHFLQSNFSGKDFQYVKMLVCEFSAVSSDFRRSSNFDANNKHALKSISCIWKSSITIHSNVDKSKSSLHFSSINLVIS